MPSHRGHQKRLEKKKKQRLEAQRASKKPLSPPLTAIVRQAAISPFGSVYMSSSWRSELPELVTSMVTRLVEGVGVVVGVALVDRTCLGVKSGFARVIGSSRELEDLLAKVASAHDGDIEEVSILEAQSVVFHALDYARSLGFAPDPDFPEALFGPRPDTLLDTPLASPPQPIFVAGPNDDIDAIAAVLEAR